jgi:hypothetical protein
MGCSGPDATRRSSRIVPSFPQVVPPFDFGPKPEQGAVRPEVDDGSRHIRIAALIQADAVGLRQPKDLGHSASVDQVLCTHERAHRPESIAVDNTSSRSSI